MNMKKFNERMARPRYSKGGYIKKIADRKYFDDGGIAANSNSPGVGGPGNPTNATTNGVGGIAQALGLNAASANIQNGTNAAQLNNAYTGANNAINAQVGLTNTLTPQAANGVNAQNAAEAQDLAIANGAGPNPAQNELAQATGTNVNNEAALLAGQRGAGANVGLAARNIGNVGANTMQNSAGQAATLGAQQAITANQAAAGIGANQIGETQGATTALNQAQQNEQSTLQNANTASNNAAVGMQSNINNVNAQASQGVLGGITSGLSSLTGGLLNKGGSVEPVNPHGKHKLEFIHKMAKMGLEHFDGGGTVSSPNSPSSMGVPAPVLNAFKFADGGPIPGNPLTSTMPNAPVSMPQGQYNQAQAAGGPNIESTPGSSLNLGKNVQAGFRAGHDWKMKQGTNAANAAAPANTSTFNNELSAGPAQTQDASVYQQNAAHGGKIFDVHPTEHAKFAATHFSMYAKGGAAKDVQAMVSPNERYWNPEEVEQIKHGQDPFKVGTVFPGKDKVPGKDSLKNDVLPVTLQEGGIVNPLHIEKTKNPDKARLFVLKSLKATGKHMKKPAGMN